MPFKWHINDPPPAVEEHSMAKLAVLRRYIRAYFDRLGTNPARDQFRLDLVDGFAGGGIFQNGRDVVPGTPLIMLEEYKAAESRLNHGRNKPLHFDCKFHFVDVNREHTDYLRRVLADRGYRVDGGEIVVHTSPFEDVADDIVTEIRQRQPQAGRSIFLLDQTGFSQVELALVARILERLPAAEVIMTFAADALLNHLSESPAMIKAVAPLGLTDLQIADLIQLQGGDGGRALVQRVMRQHFRSATKATFDTPFFIRPKRSHRALWFLHLSRHPTARDVMIQCHWDSSNTFEHYGTGDFDMLGWNALVPGSGTLPLFHFGELDAEQMQEQLLNSMPGEIRALASAGPITVDTMRHMFANRTAARFSDLDTVILKLSYEKEFDILNSEGKKRSRRLTRLRPTDLISVPELRLFPEFSRLQ